MTEEAQAQESQEQTEGTPQEGNEQQAETQQQEQQTEGQEPVSEAGSVDALPAWAQKQLKDARKEAAKYRTDLKKREDADKTELERLTEERDGLTKERETWQRERTANAFQSQINLPSPRLALGAAREMGIEIALDDSGKVKNLEAIRKQLKTQYAREFGDGSADGAATGKTPNAQDMNSMLRSAAGRG